MDSFPTPPQDCRIRLLALALLLTACGEATPLDSSPPDPSDTTDSVAAPNQAPTAPVITLEPAEPTTLDDLGVTVVVEGEDPDGDPVQTEIRWLQDGEETGYVGSVLPASATSRGQTWSARARTTDGQADSAETEASVTVFNSAPEPPELAVLPWAPREDEDLVCVEDENATDADGDPLTLVFTWTVDGEAFTETATTLREGDTVPGHVTHGKQRWTCTVTVSDPEEASAVAQASNSIERTLTRGYRVLSEWGLSLQTWDNFEGAYTDAATWAESNLTTPWGTHLVDDFPDQPFGLISSGSASPMDLAETYAPWADRLTTIQLGDEEYFSEEWLESNGGFIRETWAHLPNVVVHTNQWIGQIYGEEMARWVQEGRPDLLTWDTYHFNGRSVRGMGQPFMLSNLQLYREFAAAGHDGAGEEPIPFGQYAQAFEVTSGYTLSESELRLYPFATWTFGGRWLSLFAWNSWYEGGAGEMTLFDTFPNEDPTPSFYEYAEALGESRNLSPALSALFSTYVVIKVGSHACDVGACRNPLPHETRYFLTAVVPEWNSEQAPWIKGLKVENLGTHNDGLPGDVVIGTFEPLLESCDGPEVHGEPYWMVLNAFVALNEGGRYVKTGDASETAQRVTLTFQLPETPADGEPIVEAIRLQRETGALERLPLQILEDGLGTLELEIPGGTADLFKLDTGAAFCGIEDPRQTP